jgi:hypothetical protein
MLIRNEYKNFVERRFGLMEQTGTGLFSWLGIIEIYTESGHRQTITKRAFRVYWCNVVIRQDESFMTNKQERRQINNVITRLMLMNTLCLCEWLRMKLMLCRIDFNQAPMI